MNRITLMVIPSNANKTTRVVVPGFVIKLFFAVCILVSGFAGYLILDYVQLRNIRSNHFRLMAENQHLKGEAQILINNLEEVKYSLRRIQDYTHKLDEIVNLRMRTVSKRVGIGPLTSEEYSEANKENREAATTEASSQSAVPLGINIDNLIFKPVVEKLDDINVQSHRQVLDLQRLLSTLSQKKSILSAIPAIIPVDGWVVSGFGSRISPFTGSRTTHKGIDIAAPVGTPIHAPADGVVVFAGTKVGFGNFIMVAHYGYGIITRYGHNAQNMVRIGQKIRRGEQIATVGLSGRTTGPHLHYEVWVNGAAVNPSKFILE